MKCPKCSAEMKRVHSGNDIYYYQCEDCGNTIGRPQQSITDILDEITKEQAE